MTCRFQDPLEEKLMGKTQRLLTWAEIISPRSREPGPCYPALTPLSSPLAVLAPDSSRTGEWAKMTIPCGLVHAYQPHTYMRHVLAQ